MKQEITCARF